MKLNEYVRSSIDDRIKYFVETKGQAHFSFAWKSVVERSRSLCLKAFDRRYLNSEMF